MFLQLQHDRLPTDNVDRVLLAAVLQMLTTQTTIAVTRVQAVVMLRYLRRSSEEMGRDMIALEERRIRGGVNGSLDAAYGALDADRTLLQDVIRRLWEIVL